MNTEIISIVDSSLDLDGQKIISYPHSAMELHITLPSHKNKNPRVVRAYATVDLIKNTAIRADSFPELIKVKVNKDSVLPQKISSDAAIEAAKEKIISWVKRRYRLIITPKIEVVEIVPIYYHPFVISKDKKGRPIMVNVVRDTAERWKG